MFALPLVLMESNFPFWISVYSELYLQCMVFRPLLAAFYPPGCFPLTGDGEKSAGIGGLLLTEAQLGETNSTVHHLYIRTEGFPLKHQNALVCPLISSFATLHCPLPLVFADLMCLALPLLSPSLMKTQNLSRHPSIHLLSKYAPNS